MDPEQIRPFVNSYLGRQKSRLQFVSVDAMMLEVRIWVPRARGLSDKDLRDLIMGYYLVNGVFLAGLVPPPTGPDDKIVKAVQDSVSSPTKKVKVKRDGGKVSISLSGLTAELTRGLSTTGVTGGPSGLTLSSSTPAGTTSINLSLGGTLSLTTVTESFYLTTSVAKDKWQIKLNYPTDTPVPDLPKLGRVFGEGEKAAIGIARAALGDPPGGQLLGTISPLLPPVQAAMEAAQGIGTKKNTPISLAFQVGSTDPLLGETGMPTGIQGGFTLTYFF